MATASLTSKGRATIPKVVCEHLHLHPGDQIKFFIEDERVVTLRRAVVWLSELKGLLKGQRSKPVSIEEMNKLIKRRGSHTK